MSNKHKCPNCYPALFAEEKERFKEKFQGVLLGKIRTYFSITRSGTILVNKKGSRYTKAIAYSHFIPDLTLGINSTSIVPIKFYLSAKFSEGYKDIKTADLNYYQQWRNNKINVITNRFRNAHVDDDKTLLSVTANLASELVEPYLLSLQNGKIKFLNDHDMDKFVGDLANKMMAYIGSFRCLTTPSTPQELTNTLKLSLKSHITIPPIAPGESHRSYDNNEVLNNFLRDIHLEEAANGNLKIRHNFQTLDPVDKKMSLQLRP